MNLELSLAPPPAGSGHNLWLPPVPRGGGLLSHDPGSSGAMGGSLAWVCSPLSPLLSLLSSIPLPSIFFPLPSPPDLRFVKRFPYISPVCITMPFDLRETPSRLGLHNNARFLCLLSWTLIQHDCQDDLREAPSRLVCITMPVA